MRLKRFGTPGRDVDLWATNGWLYKCETHTHTRTCTYIFIYTYTYIIIYIHVWWYYIYIYIDTNAHDTHIIYIEIIRDPCSDLGIYLFCVFLFLGSHAQVQRFAMSASNLEIHHHWILDPCPADSPSVTLQDDIAWHIFTILPLPISILLLIYPPNQKQPSIK